VQLTLKYNHRLKIRLYLILLKVKLEPIYRTITMKVSLKKLILNFP